MELNVGDEVKLVAPSGASRTVIVTEIIRDLFSQEILALSFEGWNGPVTLSIKFFETLPKVIT